MGLTVKGVSITSKRVMVPTATLLMFVLGGLAWFVRVAFADRSETKGAIASLVASTQARQVQSDMRYQELSQKFTTIDARGERIESKLDSLIRMLLERRLAGGDE